MPGLSSDLPTILFTAGAAAANAIGIAFPQTTGTSSSNPCDPNHAIIQTALDIALSQGDPIAMATAMTNLFGGSGCTTNRPTNTCGTGNSFTPTTPILLPDGTTTPITNLQPGDQVLATNPNTNQTQPETITATHTNTDHQQTTITLQNHTTITTTPNHPIYNTTTHTWTPASDLTPGQTLLQPNGTSTTIHSITTTNTTAVMHNLTTTNTHTYYVIAGDTPVLVHNSGGELCDVLPDNIRDLSVSNITNSGDTVLGHFPGYINKANARGASYFDIGDAWDSLSPAQRWAANTHFLTLSRREAIACSCRSRRRKFGRAVT